MLNITRGVMLHVQHVALCIVVQTLQSHITHHHNGMARTRSKAWVFTLNNWVDEEADVLCGMYHEGQASYMLFGVETGESGTPHLQGYVELISRVSLSSLKDLIGLSRIHLEPRRGSQQEAISYCKKDGDFVELGSASRQGRRTDLDSIQQAIKDGANQMEVADRFFSQWVVYRRSFEAYDNMLHNDTPRRWETEVTVYIGATGTGKSRTVHELEPRLFVASLPSRGGAPWFDGYRGHEAVLFDDYRGEYEFSLLLRLLDRYPMSVPIKGGFVNWQPKRIYITSNRHVEFWYPGLGEGLEPLNRRITNKIVLD